MCVDEIEEGMWIMQLLLIIGVSHFSFFLDLARDLNANGGKALPREQPARRLFLQPSQTIVAPGPSEHAGSNF